MSEDNMFEILTEWSSAEAAPDLERQTAAELTLKLGTHVLTRGYDTWSRTVTERARISLYPMAAWLASNWWRIRYEPRRTTHSSLSAHWRLAHDLPAAGHGYIWPAVRLAPDGEFMQVSAQVGGQGRWEPRRYQVSTGPLPVTMSCFDSEIDGFLSLVIERLMATGADASPLQALWMDVLAERRDPEVSAWRQMEARLGYDADEAPNWLMTRLGSLEEIAGRAALEEIAPGIGMELSSERLKQITDLATAPGMDAKVDLAIATGDFSGETPWSRGRKLADAVRRQTSVAVGPVSDEDLTRLLGLSRNALEPNVVDGMPIGLGVRDVETGRLALHFRRKYWFGRRFEAARFLADQLAAPNADVWLPQTDMATARQKVQRAFATEFLMPIDDLRDFLGPDITADAIDDAANRYQVSALAVSRHLQNHKIIAPEDATIA